VAAVGLKTPNVSARHLLQAGVFVLAIGGVSFPNADRMPRDALNTPFSSVAMLEKLALLKMAFCSAPVFNSASLRRISAPPSPEPAGTSDPVDEYIRVAVRPWPSARPSDG
jgi:hypothetical protein